MNGMFILYRVMVNLHEEDVESSREAVAHCYNQIWDFRNYVEMQMLIKAGLPSIPDLDATQKSVD